MEYKVIKVFNAKEINNDEIVDVKNAHNIKVGEHIELKGQDWVITQTGEVIALVKYDLGGKSSLCILHRAYPKKDYITNYNDIVSNKDIIVHPKEKWIKVITPMSMEALYKYFRYRVRPKEPAIKVIGDDYYMFINGWRFRDAESQGKIKAGSWTYESHAVMGGLNELGSV